MTDRVDRLLDKAETAADNNNTDQVDAYLSIAALSQYIRDREIKQAEKAYRTTPGTDALG